MIEVVGIGADGWGGLSEHPRNLIAAADVIVGGPRHLAMLPPSVRPDQQRRPWPRPLRSQLRHTVPSHGRVVVLASGDPLVSGVGSTLIEEFGHQAVRIHPGVSSVSIARARMGWPVEQVTTVSGVGRSLAPLRAALHPRGRFIVLCGDGATPGLCAQGLVAEGYPDAALTVWWHLGGPEEGHHTGTADHWKLDAAPDLNLLCVQTYAARPGRSPGRSPGLPDDAFDHDGQLTKREVRATALAHLRPNPGALLWDLGAGAGSIGIEWARAHPTCRVVAVEHDPLRARRAETNAARLGVPADARRGCGVRVITATVRDFLDSPEAESSSAHVSGAHSPDAVFLGGGITEEVIDDVVGRLALGGRLVAHAVTVETEAVLAAAAGRHGGELTRISVERLTTLGSYRSWTPRRAVTQWALLAPGHRNADPPSRCAL